LARPQKVGIDYFPLDVDIDQDDKVAIIEAQHGIRGFGVVVKLLMHIYKNSYYYEWTEKEQILFARRVNVDINEVNVIINDCVKWGLFDEELFNTFKILTSRGVQKRYLEITKRRQEVEVIKEYLLLDNDDINSYTNLVIVSINKETDNINDDINTQSKVKESKEKKIKELLAGSSSFSSQEELSATEEKDNKEFKELAQLYQQCGFQVNGLTHQWLTELLNQYSIEWCKNAIKESEKRGKRTKKYVEGILENWNKNGGMKLGGDQPGSITSNGGANKKYDVSKFINQG